VARGRVAKTDLAEALGRIALDIDYPNFKSEVAQRMGYAREQVYDDVWETLAVLQERQEPARQNKESKA